MTAATLLAATLLASTVGVRDLLRSTFDDEIARLTAPFPPARAELTAPDEERPTSPGPLRRRIPGTNLTPDLVALARAATVGAREPDAELLERVRAGLMRLDDPPAVLARRARPDWDTPTAEFNMIVGGLYTTAEYQALIRRWMCWSCETGRDGERPHASCSGCSCPCGVSVR